jgi:hypothetical protein
MIWEKDTKPDEHRKPVTRAVLEQQPTEAVRTGHAEFEGFVGLMVERVAAASPGSSTGPSGVSKYRRANRDRSSAVLSHCVEEAQQEFEVMD